jgi:alpha,alpha-trehalose phosphorylase
LSAATQAVLAAEVGHLELAHAYLAETSLVDLRDIFGNTANGVHIAALAGSWLALVAGLGGLRDHDGRLSFAPRLPSRIDRLDFSIHWHGLRLRVSVRPDEARYMLRAGSADPSSTVEFTHHGEPVTLRVGEAQVRPIPPPPVVAAPEQPPGRAPLRRP